MIYPVLFMALGAFTTNERFRETVFLPIPNTLNIGLFISTLSGGMDWAYILTTLRVGFYVGMNLLVGMLAGYIFSKLRFPGRNLIFLIFLTGLVMPSILMIVPLYLMMARFPLAGGNNLLGSGGHGFIGEWPVLFITGWVSPFAIFLLKQNFDMLPNEYEDSAKMDGAGILTIIFRVYGPLLKPAIVALIIITSVNVWNDYLWPSLTVISHQMLYPISMYVTYISGVNSGYYPGAMASALLALLPPALLYLLLQRYFVQGMITSGLKG